MHILVCFRPEPNMELLPASAWQENQIPKELIYLKPGWNCFEESALALALALRKASGDAVTLSALTVGSGPWSSFAQTLYALGFSEVLAVEGENPSFHPHYTAQAVAAVAEKLGCDAVMLGQQSGLGGSGSVPLLTAENLHWPCVTGVTNLAWEEGAATVTSSSELGTLVQRCPDKCVLCVANAVLTALPVPTLRDKLSLGRKPVTKIPPDELGLSEISPAFTLRGLTPIRHDRTGEILSGDPAELARQLLAFCRGNEEVQQ